MTADKATQAVMSHRLLRRYVLPGERVVLAMRRHWAKLAPPALQSLGVLVVCAVVSYALEPTLGQNAYLVLWLWFVSLARFVWLLLLWRVEWFVATDKRMLLATGLITHQVAMMPLMKVTDMRYSRSVVGQMLGYGKFLLESAGQDQALRELNWVADPDATYRDLCALIFTPSAPARSDGEDDAGPTDAAHPVPQQVPVLSPQPAPRPGPRPAPQPVAHEPASAPPIAPPDSPSASPRAVQASGPPVIAPAPMVVPGRSHDWDQGAPTDPPGEYGPEDTQPLRVNVRERDERAERAWEISEPSAVFVDLRRERGRD